MTLDVALASVERRDLAAIDLMRQIGLGIRAIHAGGFACRSLSPRAILIEQATKRAILTNFEMAKAADGGPTVTAGQELAHNPDRARR